MVHRVQREGETSNSDVASGKPRDDAAEELAILFPDRQAKIGGRLVTVREYTFSEGLLLAPAAKPFLDSLYSLVTAGGSAPTLEQINDVCSLHAAVVLDLVAKSADVERPWIDTLNEEEGDLLLLMWWTANSGFFIRRVLRRAIAERRAAHPSNGLASSPL